MSEAGIEIVKEFFMANRFFVLREKDVIYVKNSVQVEPPVFERFSVCREDASRIKNAAVKVVSWHTMKFTPSVLHNNPEIFDFTGETDKQSAEKFFSGGVFLKMLVIPSMPASDNLVSESIGIMKKNGVDNIMTFPAVIAGLIEKIEPRKVYVSSVKELLRTLKFYRFFAEEEQRLPF